MAEVSPVESPSDECHFILLVISQHWFRWWLGSIRQQANTWANVDQDLCNHMVSLGHNELRHCNSLKYWAPLGFIWHSYQQAWYFLIWIMQCSVQDRLTWVSCTFTSGSLKRKNCHDDNFVISDDSRVTATCSATSDSQVGIMTSGIGGAADDAARQKRPYSVIHPQISMA